MLNEDATVDFAMQFESGCRDCADAHGTCPSSGMPCDPDTRRATVTHTVRAINYGLANAYLDRSSSNEAVATEVPCPQCGRNVMANPHPATGFLGSCGRRLTTNNELLPGGCDAAIRSALEPSPAPPPKANDPHFYQLSNGSFAPYPHCMTEDEWNTQIGEPSYERAKDLPSD